MTHWRAASTSGRLTAGAHHQPSALRADTPRDLPKLPAHSLRDASDFDDAHRSSIVGRLAVVFLSLCFLIPLFCAGVILRFQ